MRFPAKFVALSLGILAATAQSAEPQNEPQTVAQVDIPRYMGTWYEQVRLPMRFQDGCVSDVKAQYRLTEKQVVKITNSCRKKDGSMISADAEVKKVDENGSKLRISFLPKAINWVPVARSSYWILRLDDNYQTALVGTPNRKYLWVLSREPKLDEATLQSYIETAKQQGYDVSKLIRSVQ
ncbi:lipocalin family protein [Neisseria weixii]|uniref:lipocalin family protein n=1 Tax=Neisseria weixii TaxID=1853276 RepID=UPI0035A12D52